MSGNNFSMDPVRAMRDLYCEKLAPLFAELDIAIHALSEDKLETIDTLFETRAWNINWQAMSTLGFAIAGGGFQLGGSFAKANGLEDLHKLLEAAGTILPKGGDVASTVLRSKDVLTEGALNKLAQHRQPDDEKVRKQISDSEEKLVNNASKLGQQQAALFRSAKGG